MKSQLRLVAAILAITVTGFATDVPRTDIGLVALLSDHSALSITDETSMGAYIRRIRDWLIVQRGLSRENSFAEARGIVAGKTAEEVALIGELVDRLDRNMQLIESLELDSMAARRLFDVGITGKLTDSQLEDLALSEAAVQLSLKRRFATKLPKLEFRQKK